MINVGENFKLLNDILSKNNYQGISPSEYERYLYLAISELFDDLRGSKNKAVTAYGLNRVLDSRLNPFKETIQIAFSANVYTKPNELAQILALYTSDGKIPIKPIDEDRYANVYRNPLARPSSSEYWYIEGKSTLNLLGSIGSLSCEMVYIKYPTYPKYAYTLDVDGRVVYDNANSIHCEFDKNMEADLINRMLVYIGISGRDSFLTQIGINGKNNE